MAMRLAVLSILCVVTASAQNIEASRYPQYRADLEAYQAAFNNPATAEKAEEIARGGLADSQAKQDRDASAHWLRMIGATFERRNDLILARQFYEQSLELRRELKQPADILLLSNGIGFVCVRSRDFPAARKYLAEAQTLATDLKDNSALGRAFSVTGQLEDAQGRKAEAAAQYQRSAAAYLAAGANFETGVSRLALARVSTDLSDFPAALKAGFEAIRVLSSTPPRQGAAALATAFDIVGTVFHRLEQPVKALDYFRQALDLRTKNVPGALAESYALIGVELDKTEAHAEAVDYLKKALDARRPTKNAVLIAGALTNLAVAQKNLGEVATARQNFNEALALIANNASARPQQATALYNLGNIEIDAGEFEAALLHHRQALALRRDLRDSLGIIRSLNRIGIALEKSNDWKAALDVHHEAMTAFESLMATIADPVQAAQFRETSAILYPHYANALVRLKRSEEALLTIERSRGIGFARIAELAASRGTPVQNRTGQQALAAAAAKFARARNRLTAAVQREDKAEKEAAEIAFLDSDRELTRARDELFAAVSMSRDARGPSRGVNFDDLRRLAAGHPDTLFLEWTAFDSGTLLFALSQRDGFMTFSLPSPVAQIAATLERWDRSLRSGRNSRGIALVGPPGSVSEELALAKRSYEMVLGPASAILDRPFKRLVIVADGPIQRVPFAALADARGTRLIERFAISGAVSITSLLKSQSRSAANPRVFAVGDPIGAAETRFIVPQSVHLKPLAGAREEALAIAALFPGSATLVGPQAREGSAKSRMPAYQILHFATHGLLEASDPLKSALLFAAEPRSSSEDGLLEAWEIASMRLSAQLAVLSACDTGQGAETLGDGVLGLSWAFQAAGCPNVVASLWSIDDAATRAVMIAFYKGILAGKRIDDAMRAAMLQVRASKEYSPPYYWGAFQVIGPAGRVGSPSKVN